ncbi:MAG: FGGY family carbohydrate kinase, partial [Emergencia sp.]
AIQWLRDELEILNNSAESEAMALSVPDANGVVVVPAFVGLGAPYWDPYARGSIFGLTRGVSRNHLVRATLESLAYQCNDLLAAMANDLGKELVSLKVDGGACANNFLMQFQSDILQKDVLRPQCIETTSLGAAYLAGLATGYWKNQEDVLQNWQIDKVFHPTMEEEKRRSLLDDWKKAVERTLGWSK